MSSRKKPLTVADFLLGFLRLVRWPNLLILALMQYLTRLFLIGPPENWHHIWQESTLLLITLSTVLIAAAGYIINDYFDVKIDLINKPRRVIIGRYLKRRVAMGAHQTLNVLGCLLALLVSKWVFLLSVFSVTLLWFYSSYFKRKPLIGNLIVAFLSALSLLILSIYYRKNTDLVLLYAFFAFGISLVREIIKDMEDLRGDASHGCRTLPIVWGIRPTKLFVYLLVALFIAALFLSAHALQNLYLAWIFTFILLPIAWLIYRLVYADTRHEFAALSRLCKWIMLGGILSMIWV